MGRASGRAGTRGPLRGLTWRAALSPPPASVPAVSFLAFAPGSCYILGIYIYICICTYTHTNTYFLLFLTNIMVYWVQVLFLDFVT